VAGIWGPEIFTAVIARDGAAEDAETWLMATGHGAASQEADAGHAASWHPLVAKAVADWLDAEAEHAMSIDGYEDSAAYPLMLDGYRLPLAVARAYLAETEEVQR
jgi:hypothetical protein